MLRKALEELVVDLLVYKDTRASTAALSMVEAGRDVSTPSAPAAGDNVLNTKRRPLDRLLHVCVVQNDRGRLAAELERNLLQVRLRSRLHDLTTDERAARERDLARTYSSAWDAQRRGARARTFSMPSCSEIAWPTVAP